MAFREKQSKSKSDLVAVERPPIHPTAVYDVESAAAHTTFCIKTIREALNKNEIAYSQKGTRQVILGQNLLEWILRDERKIAA